MLLILGLAFFLNLSYPTTRVYEATARWQGEVVYYERHRDLYEQGILQQSAIDYLNHEGKLVGFEEVDYRIDPEVPNYFFRDFRQGLTQGMQLKDSRVQMFCRSGPGAKLKFKELLLSRDGTWLVWPALINYIGKELESLIKENNKEIHLIIPGKLRAYKFRVELTNYSSHLVKLRLRLANWKIGLFSLGTNMLFDRIKGRILSYEGVSRLRDSRGEMVIVKVRYRYPD